MAYSTLAQVTALIVAANIEGLQIPSNSNVALIQAMRESDIDAALLSRGLVVPVTYPPAFVNELGTLEARGTAGDILMQTLPAFVDSSNGEPSPYARHLLDMFTARIAELQEGVGIPVGAARQELTQAPGSFLVDSGAWGSNSEPPSSAGAPGDFDEGSTGTGVQDAFGDTIVAKPFFRVGRPI